MGTSGLLIELFMQFALGNCIEHQMITLCSGVRQNVFKFWLLHLFTAAFGANYLTTLGLNLLIYKRWYVAIIVALS